MSDKQLTLTTPPPGDLLAIIAHAVSDRSIDVSKMERLLAMHERITEEQRKVAYHDAMALLQSAVPQIDKHGKVYVKGSLQRTYAKLEDIDVIIRPMLAQHGFSFSWSEEPITELGRRFVGTMAHRDGYSETKHITLSLDTSGSKNNIQAVGSTASYARRYLLKMFLNIVERGEDNDGAGSDEPISEDEALDLQSKLEEVGGNKEGFLKWMGVESISNIRKRDLQKAISGLEAKRKA